MGLPPVILPRKDEGRRRPPAFYALAPGSWRDYVNLLHLPYTCWHLSFVAYGAALAPTLHLDRLLGSLLAFFLAVGVGAHALDELQGRPLGTHLPWPVLVALATVSLGGTVALGGLAWVLVSPWVVPFIVAGVFLVLSYNLELAGGRFHNWFWFAAGWGAFPVLASAWSQTLQVTPAAIIAAAAAFLLSAVQRTLSLPAKRARRLPTPDSDGTRYRESVQSYERALWLLSLALPALAAALLLGLKGR